jgi:hypothetical protein
MKAFPGDLSFSDEITAAMVRRMERAYVFRRTLEPPPGKQRIAEGLKTVRGAIPGLTKAELARRMRMRGFSKFQTDRASRLELGYADAEWHEIVALAAILRVSPTSLCSKP